MINIAVSGASGRMGQRLIALIKSADDLNLSGAIERKDSVSIGKLASESIRITDDPRNAIKNSDILIEFSTPAATMKHLSLVKDLSKKMVIGSTGLTDENVEDIKDASKNCVILMSPNMSLGVNILFKLSEIVTKLLIGKGFDIEILEAHHHSKVDAPSGTAKKIAEIIADELNLSLPEIAKYGRHGLVGKRSDTEIGIHSIRGGDIVGDHKVIYAGQGEMLEISHRATSRDTFAAGALQAARFIYGKSNGQYSMNDLLIR